MLKEFRLEDKVAIVTGAGRGIGKAIALTLAEAGADVVVTARTQDQIEAVATEVQGFGRRAIAVEADVTRRKDVDRVVAAALETYGRIDILVNNAGLVILKPIVYVEGMRMEGWQVADAWDAPLSEDEWRRVLDTDLTSVFHFVQAVGPHMLRRRQGKVINISSNSAEIAPPYFSAYCVSKAALSMFTRCLATEWGPYGVNVNAIGPGSVLTDLSAPVLDDPERRQAILGAIPSGRMASSREVGLMVAYLSSDAAGYVNGQTFYIDGGQTSRGNGF